MDDLEAVIAKKGIQPLDRRGREECWQARDAYFSCLSASTTESGEEKKSRCRAAFLQFESKCPLYWV